jgi:DNA repair protein RecO (recombination protein O)
MIETAAGLVLRTRPLTETSLIVHWLTPTLGRLATVAKGARRANSPLRGKLDLFYLADFSFSRSRRSELHTLCEVSLRQTHSGLREDLGLLQQACYCAALVEQSTEMETPLGGVFELMMGLLGLLVAGPSHQPWGDLDGPLSPSLSPSRGERVPKAGEGAVHSPEVRRRVGEAPHATTIFAFELKLLNDLGLKPDLDKSNLNPGTKQLVKALAEKDWPVVARLKPTPAQAAELGHFLHGFLIYHLGRIPKGREAALGLRP